MISVAVDGSRESKTVRDGGEGRALHRDPEGDLGARSTRPRPRSKSTSDTSGTRATARVDRHHRVGDRASSSRPPRRCTCSARNAARSSTPNSERGRASGRTSRSRPTPIATCSCRPRASSRWCVERGWLARIPRSVRASGSAGREASRSASRADAARERGARLVREGGRARGGRRRGSDRGTRRASARDASERDLLRGSVPISTKTGRPEICCGSRAARPPQDVARSRSRRCFARCSSLRRRTSSAEAYLFESEHGKPHWRDWIIKNVRRICDYAEVPKVTAHAMRGLLATLTAERGSPADLIAATLGHEDERTTMRHTRRRELRPRVRIPRASPSRRRATEHARVR